MTKEDRTGQTYLPLEEVLVVIDRVAVSQRPHLILEHLLVDSKVGIAVEVVVPRCHLLDGHLRGCRISGCAHFCAIRCRLHIVVLHWNSRREKLSGDKNTRSTAFTAFTAKLRCV